MSRVSNLHVLATVVAVVAVAVALGACGSSGGSDANPQQVIDSATLEGIESGKIELGLAVNADGKEGGDIDLNLSGPFQGEGQGELPQLDVNVEASGEARGEPIDLDAGLVLLPNTAFVDFEGTEYEVDPTTYAFVESSLQQAQRESGGEGESGETTACQEEIGKLRFSEFIENAQNDGSADVGGESTTKISGTLDVPAALDQAVKIARTPGCQAQASALGELPSNTEIDEASDEVRRAVKSAKVELYVGEDDIVRRFVIEVRAEPKKSSDGPSKVEFDLDLQLTDVNEEQEISAPSEGEPLSGLFTELDINPIELLTLLQGEGELSELDIDELLEKLSNATR